MFRKLQHHCGNSSTLRHTWSAFGSHANKHCCREKQILMQFPEKFWQALHSFCILEDIFSGWIIAWKKVMQENKLKFVPYCWIFSAIFNMWKENHSFNACFFLFTFTCQWREYWQSFIFCLRNSFTTKKKQVYRTMSCKIHQKRIKVRFFGKLEFVKKMGNDCKFAVEFK